MSEEERNYWRKCSTCKKEIGFNVAYQTCSVSSCRKWAYCSVNCWDEHNPVMNHKSSWAEENVSPRKSETPSAGSGDADERPRRRIVVSQPKSGRSINNQDVPREILIVASKLKNYVKERHGFNTSADVMDRLSDLVRFICDDAVQQSRIDGRKTLMARDFI